MIRIALISDTHNYIPPEFFKYVEECDEIWHAGDIGNYDIIERLSKVKPVRVVYGNIDGGDIRKRCKAEVVFNCEKVKVYMTHIAGYPKRYKPLAKERILKFRPNLVICGHSHILKVVYDKQLEHLHMNPGAIGKYGFHLVRTMLRFTIDGANIKDLEVIELGKRI